MGVGVARCLNNRRMPLAIDAEMAMRMGGRAHGIAGDSYTAIRTVLEPYRHAQAAGHFPVDL
ncbi:hypothetical protein D3C86_2192370 [compost metagenome]